jgi:Cof subfamily protein (haloacid dehalogenase superfamily)
MIRLIGIDVDGTLLDSRGRMPDENRDAIRDAVARGVHVALVTGRSYPFARPVADALPPEVTLIVSNGAIERATDGTTLARRLLPRMVARQILERMRPYRDCAALIFDRNAARQFIFETMDWQDENRKGYWTRNQSLIECSVPLEDALTEDPIQVVFNGPVRRMREVAGVLQAKVSPTEAAVSLTEYEARDFTLVDITAPSATKGHALAWRAAEMGLSPAEVMAVGDNFNDVEMLSFAGCPVVMGNAVLPLKERGWPVTGGHDESGLAEAIRRYVLQPGGSRSDTPP